MISTGVHCLIPWQLPRDQGWQAILAALRRNGGITGAIRPKGEALFCLALFFVHALICDPGDRDDLFFLGCVQYPNAPRAA